MFTATWLLHKEILIHHATWTEVKSRWATIHPQLLVTVVDSAACPPRSVFEVSGWTQRFWVSRPQKSGCGVNKSEDRAFTFAQVGKKKKKRFDSFFCESLNMGHFQTALGTRGGGITPSRNHDRTKLSQNLKMKQGQRCSYAGAASHTAVAGGGGFRGRTQRCGFTQMRLTPVSKFPSRWKSYGGTWDKPQRARCCVVMSHHEPLVRAENLNRATE